MFGFQNNDEKGAVQENMTLEQVRKAMIELMKEENSNQHRMGQLYNYVVKNKLAQNAGYKDARDYFSKNLADLSQAALTMYGTVALQFSEEVARRFGVTCLSLLLYYKAAAELKVNHEEPGSTPIEVPADNGQASTKLFGDCSVEDMRKALRHKRKPSSSKPVPAQYVVLADRYEQAMSNRFPKGVVIKVEARNQKGDSVYDIKGIPVEQMGTLLEALMDELPPTPQLLPLVPLVPQVEPAATVS
ncbi:MAG TPA: hypothetical protein VNA24_20240 [Hyalangium sp.]|nr:hypothetical protein [Hyalangium sp.]